MNHSSTFSSNSIRLSWRNWAAVIAVLALIFYLVPKIFQTLERFNPSENYRLPYSLSDDYFVFARWSKYACSNYPALVIGDSVIWGQYVAMDQTLPHYLNELAGENIFANMGIDGLHPAAMLGLIKYYGRAIQNKRVILHLNPLWMSSQRHDLRGDEEFPFNHPRLVPQFFPKPPCYKPPLAQRIGVVLERNLSFVSWVNHIRICYFQNMNLQSWSIENPYKNPIKAITLKLPKPEKTPRIKPVTWFEAGVRKQDFPWVRIEESFQWNSFKKLIQMLKKRKNKVFVIVGPFNPYILTKDSLNRYNDMKDKVENWLEEEEINYISVSDLPSKYYADASHPLKEGYAEIANQLFETKSFRKWLENLEAGEIEKQKSNR